MSLLNLLYEIIGDIVENADIAVILHEGFRWDVVTQAMGEITDLHPGYDFVIVKQEEGDDR